MKIMIYLENFLDIIGFVKVFVINLFTYKISLKIININKISRFDKIETFLLIAIISLVFFQLRNSISLILSTVILIIILSFMLVYKTKTSIFKAMILSIIGLTINYILFVIASSIVYPISKILKISNEYIIFLIIIIIYYILIKLFERAKRIDKGFSFFKKSLNNELYELLLLNISVVIIFSIILIINYPKLEDGGTVVGFIIFSVIMFITIKKSFQLYYQQKLLIQDLNETKEELNKKNEEITKLEKENLSFSKKSHSLAHKQKALEYKLNQLMMKTETAEEIELKEKLDKISNELYSETEIIELPKTGITEIDDMLTYMQSECKKNKIDFDLQIAGNIYQMTNNFVPKEELEILLADHIKDAIIAINHTDNINRSILVRLGKIDEIYSLYIYDSGIEFEQETLEKLGKIPITTHSDEGGTGMGFMNTFETLRKHKASLTIKEIGKTSKDNYTKIIMIKFDNKNEFKIESYKK